MGICASCLKGRDKKPNGGLANETQPLLANTQDVDNDTVSENADNLSVRRQEELDHIVHATLDYFIDTSALSNADNGDQLGDMSALADSIAERTKYIELDIPTVEDLTPEERAQLDKDTPQL